MLPTKWNLWNFLVDVDCLRVDCWWTEEYMIKWDGNHRIPVPLSAVGWYKAWAWIKISSDWTISVDPNSIDMSNYYNKSEVDNLVNILNQAINNKADAWDLPTKLSQLQNDLWFITSSALWNWKITIKKNWTKVWDFTVNQDSDSDINITLDKSDVWLSNVDNTSDADKPISTAVQTALDNKANKSDMSTVYKYKWSVADKSALPSQWQEIWDVYNLEDTWMNVAWDWIKWDDLWAVVDLTWYYTKSETDVLLSNKANLSDIPTPAVVNDARITIQKNGESVDSFTLNQNTDNTINITVSKSDVWLWNVDNTSDADKPISTATQAALDDKADAADTYTKTEVDNLVNSRGDWDVKYSDFEWKTMTWTEISDLSSVIDIDSDTTLTAVNNTKPWMQYVVLVNNTDTSAHTITLWTNTSWETIEIPAESTKYLVFISVDWELQLQSCEWSGGWVTPGNWTITLTQGGVAKWTFTVNQSTDTTVDLDAPEALTVSVAIWQANLTIWRWTKAEYEAITTKDSNTLYIVIDSGGTTLKSFDEIVAMLHANETTWLAELNAHKTEYLTKFQNEWKTVPSNSNALSTDWTLGGAIMFTNGYCIYYNDTWMVAD